jgi:hypothetical protein
MSPVTALIVNSPLAFEYDPNTGLLSVVANGEMPPQKTQNLEWPAFPMSAILLLTPKIAQQLLADLPKLERLLERASKGPDKPDFLQ